MTYKELLGRTHRHNYIILYEVVNLLPSCSDLSLSTKESGSTILEQRKIVTNGGSSGICDFVLKFTFETYNL